MAITGSAFHGSAPCFIQRLFRMKGPAAIDGVGRRTWISILLVGIIGISIFRIILTYSVFNQTWDEGVHLAAGMEWMDRGAYTYEALHPPLARVSVALAPYVAGLRSFGLADPWSEGNEILHARGSYTYNLALARLGVLPFFVLAAGILWVGSRAVFGRAVALLGVLLFTTLPPVLAHAGVATTDMPFTGTFLLALLSFVLWLERPTLTRGLLLGAATGLAVLAKFSALVFLPSCGAALLLCRWVATRGVHHETAPGRSRRAAGVSVAALTAFMVVWTGYRFSVKPLTTASERPHATVDRFFGPSGRLHDLGYSVVEAVPLPAPELLLGVNQARHINAEGRKSYLLGEVREEGWWYFFPVALGVKTPIAFLLLAFIGLVAQARLARRTKDWLPVVPGTAALALLLICLTSKIDIGVRHILPIYPLLAVAAGFGVVSLWNIRRRRLLTHAAVIGMIAWHLVSSARAHPDYLAYFNEFVGRRPEHFLINSDLDWGQDLLRLSAALRARRVETVSIAYNGSADLSRHGLPSFQRLVPHQPVSGWIAISEFTFKTGGRYSPEAFAWLKAYQPVARIGSSIRLYYLPAPESAGIGENTRPPTENERPGNPAR